MFTSTRGRAEFLWPLGQLHSQQLGDLGENRLRHFFVMRTSRHAEAEIRRLAAALFGLIQPVAPTAFEDLVLDDVAGFIELRDARKEAA